MAQRKRLSLISVEVQTAQEQAIKGMPLEVPVPKKVTLMIYKTNWLIQRLPNCRIGVLTFRQHYPNSYLFLASPLH